MNLRSAGACGHAPPAAHDPPTIHVPPTIHAPSALHGSPAIQCGLRWGAGTRAVSGPLGLGRTRFEQLPRQRGRALQECGALFGPGACQRRLEQLAYDSERELLLDVAATRTQDPHPGPLGHVARRLQQRGFSDARRSTDNHKPARPSARVTDRLLHPP